MNALIWPFALVLVLGNSCQIESKHVEQTNLKSSNEASTLVDPRYSLSQDRTEFEQLRDSIPDRKKKTNDEKALLAEWMNGFRLPPTDIREKFDNLNRKKRELFNNDLTKIREQYTSSDKKKRDEFLNQLNEERTDFTRRKKDQDERNEFFNQLDEKRKIFFAEQHEKRDEFESDIRDQRKNFEDYLKERNLNFNNELKIYSERWSEQNKK